MPTSPQPESAARGIVYLVGAGPGDPSLLTRKGAHCLSIADVVVHDSLIHPALLELCPPSTLRIDVSKRKGVCHHMQSEINAALIEQARLGRIVVRLKGGDPMIYGRGGEESRALAAAGIRFEVVPGVSTLAAAPAYAGIPVTDREFGGSSVGIYTLHLNGGFGLSEDRWHAMANGPETLVLFMGLTVLSDAVVALMRHGRAPSTPVAIITEATLPTQRVYIATLATILERVKNEQLASPGLIVIGSVVGAAPFMQWSAHALETQPNTACTHPELDSTDVILVRHGAIEESHQGRYVGSTDVPLGLLGRHQSIALRTHDWVRTPQRILSSPMLRVRQTAELARPGALVDTLDSLREIDFGRWEDRAFADIQLTDPALVDAWARLDADFTFPDGESLTAFSQRAAASADAIEAEARRAGGPVLVFTHGGVMRALIAHWLGLDAHTHLHFDIPYATVVRMSVNGSRGVLRGLEAPSARRVW